MAATADKQTFVSVAATDGSLPRDAYDASDEVTDLRFESLADFVS